MHILPPAVAAAETLVGTLPSAVVVPTTVAVVPSAGAVVVLPVLCVALSACPPSRLKKNRSRLGKTFV